MLDDSWRSKQEAIEKRIAVARAYAAVLAEVASAHSELTKTFAGGNKIAALSCPEDCKADSQTLTAATQVIDRHAIALEQLISNLAQALQEAKHIS
jgi:uncharacterized membrane protein